MKLPAIPVHSFEDATLNFEAIEFTPTWITPVFQNSWVGDAGELVGYLKDPFGFVWLRGRVSGGTSATVAFTLPAGYRPGIATYYAAVLDAFASGGAVLVGKDGTVECVGAGVRLNNVRFLAEN